MYSLYLLSRHPKIRVLKTIVAKQRGLEAPGLDAGAEATSSLASGLSSDSLAIEEVADKDFPVFVWVCVCV